MPADTASRPDRLRCTSREERIAAVVHHARQIAYTFTAAEARMMQFRLLQEACRALDAHDHPEVRTDAL